jgi:hypothetical protein
MNNQKVCPINKTICEKERCGWWMAIDTKHGECAVVVVARYLRRR